MSWSTGQLHDYLVEKDLRGLATQLLSQGVAVRDFADFTEDTIVNDLRMTRFAARKLTAARDMFLVAAA